MVRDMLGHSSIRATVDMYTQIVPALKREAAERIGAAIALPSEQAG
jgi:hypothetical protein